MTRFATSPNPWFRSPTIAWTVSMLRRRKRWTEILGPTPDPTPDMEAYVQSLGPGSPDPVPTSGEPVVYQHWHQTWIVYVGSTMDFPMRQKQHERGALWWHLVDGITWERKESEQAARDSEKWGILEDGPVFNKRLDVPFGAPSTRVHAWHENKVI